MGILKCKSFKKINLLQAESLIDLINSETELQRTQALRVMNDDTTKVYNNLRTDLIKILADYEAVIDFSDDEVGDSVFFNNIILKKSTKSE